MIATRRRRARLSFAVASAIAAGCAEPRLEPQYQPARSLVEVVAELESARDLDLYRFDPPRDVTGENLYRAAFARLERLEGLIPDPSFRASIRFAEAVAAERLSDFAGASARYAEVAAMGSGLAAQARRQQPLADEMVPLVAPLSDAPDPRDMIVAIDARRAALVEKYEQSKSDPRASLIRCAIERLDVRTREFLWRFRAALPDGTQKAFEFARKVIADHAESRRVFEHTLRLGDMYAELARANLAGSDPAWIEFDAARAKNLIQSAAQVYGEVAAIDGRPEREEARAALANLEALSARIDAGPQGGTTP